MFLILLNTAMLSWYFYIQQIVNFGKCFCALEKDVYALVEYSCLCMSSSSSWLNSLVQIFICTDIFVSLFCSLLREALLNFQLCGSFYFSF